MMSGRPTSARASRNAGTSVRWPAASDETPTTCTSLSAACRATSSGVENSEPTSTSKPMSANAVAMTFCPRSCPSCPILATRMRGRRPSASANFSTISVALLTLLAIPTSSRYTPAMVRISAWCRPYTFSRASEISPTVAWARAALIASASRLLPRPSSPAVPVAAAARVNSASAASVASLSRSARSRSSLAICSARTRLFSTLRTSISWSSSTW